MNQVKKKKKKRNYLFFQARTSPIKTCVAIIKLAYSANVKTIIIGRINVMNSIPKRTEVGNVERLVDFERTLKRKCPDY